MKQITCPHCGDNYPDFDVAHVCSKGPYAPKLKPKMNERIKELLIQSEVFNKDGTVLKDVTGYELNKFAELIIENACRALNPMLRDMISRGQAVELIKQHFGVEQ